MTPCICGHYENLHDRWDDSCRLCACQKYAMAEAGV